MKTKITYVLILIIFSFSISPQASAVMMKPTSKNIVPMSTEDDGYNPDNDPLPEWLLLPDGVDENSLKYDGNERTKLIIKQAGVDRWEILVTKNGSKVQYTRYDQNKRQFVLVTNKEYTKITPYIPNGKKLQKYKSFDAETYFDQDSQLTMIEDKGSSLISKASASSISAPDPFPKMQAVKKNRLARKISKRQLNRLNHIVGFKGADARIANRVAWHESGGGDTKAVACETGDTRGANPISNGKRLYGSKAVKYCKDRGWGAGRGLYQMSNRAGDGKYCKNSCAFSPTKNAKAAYKLRKKYGWTQWCSYGGPPCKSAAGSGPGMTCKGGENCY